MNPYKILGVSQNATNAEILRAQMLAMQQREYPLQVIAMAVRQLLDPAKRLAADFMYPAKIKVRRIQTIQCSLTFKEINVNTLNENAFNSLT